MLHELNSRLYGRHANTAALEPSGNDSGFSGGKGYCHRRKYPLRTAPFQQRVVGKGRRARRIAHFRRIQVNRVRTLAGLARSPRALIEFWESSASEFASHW